MGLRRSSAAVGLLALLAGALGAVAVGPAAASCVGPTLVVDGAGAVPPGTAVPLLGAVTVSGEWFHTGCDDTGRGGCSAPRQEETAMRRVELDLEQGGRTVVLGVADAASRQQHYRVVWHVRLPDGLSPGPAVLRAAEVTLQVQLQP